MDVEPGYGHAGYPWPLDLDTAPAETGARFLQHRLIVAARAQDRLGETASATEFAALLGDVSRKKVQRHLKGERLSFAELLHWCHALNVSLSDLIGTDGVNVASLLPPLYRGQQVAPPGSPPAFVDRRKVDWHFLAGRLWERLESEIAVAAAFVSSDVLRMCLVKELTSSTKLRGELLDQMEGGIRILGRDQATVRVLAHVHPGGSDDRHTLLGALAAPTCELLVLALSATAAAITDTDVPQLRVTPVGSTFQLPESVFDTLRLPLDDIPVTWEVAGSHDAGGLHVLVLNTK